MPQSITCPHCGKGFTFAADLRGKKVRCKACQETFVVKDAAVDELDEVDDPDEGANDRIQTSPRSSRKAKPVPLKTRHHGPGHLQRLDPVLTWSGYALDA
jgi:hypothetical protein